VQGGQLPNLQHDLTDAGTKVEKDVLPGDFSDGHDVIGQTVVCLTVHLCDRQKRLRGRTLFVQAPALICSASYT
jgi:hypothetical protein